MADQVYRLIEYEIVTGGFPGGSRMRVRQLADFAGTSMPPVREAIHRLEENGLVEHAPHRGATVKSFSAAELADIYAVRLQLEPWAGRLGAEQITTDELAQMESAFAQTQAATTREDHIDALYHHSEMLGTLYRASRNHTLAETIDNLWKRSSFYRLTVSQRTGELTMGSRDQQILEAARNGDGAAAAAQIAEAMSVSISALTALSEDSV